MTIRGVGLIGCLQCDGGQLEAVTWPLTSLPDGRNQKTLHSPSRRAESLQTLIQSNRVRAADVTASDAVQ